MQKQETIDLTNLDYIFNQFDYSEHTEDIDKIRVAKKIMRIRNGTYEFDEELENTKLIGDFDFLKLPTPTNSREPNQKSPIKIYEELKIAPIKHSKSMDKLKQHNKKSLSLARKQLTYDLPDECDLSAADIMDGDRRLKTESQLIFLRFFGESRTTSLKKLKTDFFNAVDFLNKEKQNMFKIKNLADPKFFKKYYYQKNKKSNLRFYSDFLGGNLWKVYEISDCEYDIHTSVESNSNVFNFWFYFKVIYTGNQKHKSVTFNIRNSCLSNKNKKISIWNKRVKVGESIYAKYRPKRDKKGKRRTNSNKPTWSNDIEASINKVEENKETVLTFTIDLKRQEEAYLSLSYPYFITDFFTDLKLHSHPLFQPTKYRIRRTSQIKNKPAT